MNINYLLIALLGFSLMACNDASKTAAPAQATKPEMTFQNKGHKMIYDLVQKVGDYQKLLDKKDVSYTYTYTTPDGQTDVSNERYIFDGELSYGKYTRHERTLPDLGKVLEQGYNGKDYWVKADGNLVNDADALKRVAFNRPTNFYWFAMYQKLLDPDLVYQHVGSTTISDKAYDVVKVSFQSDKPTDIYQLYINEKTGLPDQFLFTVADFGMMDTPLLMQVEHETINGIVIPTKRKYKQSTWNADVDDKPWITVDWTDIKFNNGLTATDFES